MIISSVIPVTEGAFSMLKQLAWNITLMKAHLKVLTFSSIIILEYDLFIADFYCLQNRLSKMNLIK